MKKILMHSSAAYEWLSKYPENYGDMVDFVAMARQELREVNRLLQEQIAAEKQQVAEKQEVKTNG